MSPRQEPEEAVELLQKLVDEMERRGGLFREAEVGNIRDYPKPLAHIAIFNDEITDLTAHQEKELRETARNHLTLLAAKGRALGIHVFAGTQKPDGKRLPTAFRDNLPVKLTMKTVTKGDGKLITGHNLPSNHLLGKGDGFLVVPGKEPLRLQAAFIDVSKHTEHLPNLPAREQVLFPLPDIRNQPLTELQTRAVKELYAETRSIPKTVEIAWKVSKGGRKGSKYTEAHVLVTELIKAEAS
ncbi:MULTISPECIES: FtsK/SpoIIIE domain-containing protein [unclassified Moorena]|uniref:FtsK/SpoIIIE domain-containing protein n=1 Tax=unclassified Moorena TaxID=2683338 RepID=UPI00140195DF|nr:MULTISPECIES: FtsK/SpoIIIE domain-containing protein [unclassified Moorena]NEO15348.1 hypothetical protein [Moorena sp. SIO3E8]NEQ03334.1 hypothetical protein [Moorena sp. SIO3F7]